MAENNEVDQPQPFADEEGEDAVAWKELPPEREFFATPYDPPVKTLIQEIRDDELVVRPSFQRKAVWDTARKSRFVESILLNIPIPTLFFAEDDDKSKVVVDGQQRLLALKEFTENRYPLRSLEVLAPLNGRRFDDLSERQQRIINNRTLRCLVISARSDSEIRFQVFERLNQGGVALNAQEVRHCVYRGPLNDLLHELAADPQWLKLIGTDEPHPRMVDCELILRFFALRATLPNYAPPLKKRLNDYMREHRRIPPAEVQQLKGAFNSAVLAVGAVFPDAPFRRVSAQDGASKWDQNINRAVFDVQMLLMEGMFVDWLKQNAQAIRNAFEVLCLNDNEFQDALSRATADKARLTYRLRAWAEALQHLGAQVSHIARVPPVE